MTCEVQIKPLKKITNLADETGLGKFVHIAYEREGKHTLFDGQVIAIADHPVDPSKIVTVRCKGPPKFDVFILQHSGKQYIISKKDLGILQGTIYVYQCGDD